MIDWTSIKKAADMAAPDEGFADNNRRSLPAPPYNPPEPPVVNDRKGWFDSTPVSGRSPLRPVLVFDPALPAYKEPKYRGPVGFLRRTFSAGPGTTSFDTARYSAKGPGDYVIVFGGAGTGTGGTSPESIDPDGTYGKGNYAAFTWRQIPEAMKFVDSLPKGSRLHVFGHSMGGTAALAFAEQARRRGIDIAGLDLRDAVRIGDRVNALGRKIVGDTTDTASVPGNVSKATHRYNAGWINDKSDAVSMVGQRWNGIDGAWNIPAPEGMHHKQIGAGFRDNPVFPVHPGWRRDSGRSSLWRAVQGLRK